MADPQGPFIENSIQAQAMSDTKRLARLMESIDYPGPISLPDIQDALLGLYQSSSRHQSFASRHTSSLDNSWRASTLSADLSEQDPGLDFLQWVLDNVSAECNWPQFQRPSSLMSTQNLTDLEKLDDSCVLDLLQQNTEDNGEDRNAGSGHESDPDYNTVLNNLDQEQLQLQSTLSELEKELEAMKRVESEASDTNRILDMDIHDLSIQHDTMAMKLEETAYSIFGSYLSYDPAHSTSRGSSSLSKTASPIWSNSSFHTHHNTEMDPDKPGVSDIGSKSDRSSSKGPRKATANTATRSAQLLYQCREELEMIQQTDALFLQSMEEIYQDRLKLVSLSTPSPSLSSPITTESTPSASMYLEMLLRHNLDHDQKVVQLCSTYRATKMSHIRAVAQLKCLEAEIEYMKNLQERQTFEDQKRAQEDQQDGSSTTDFDVLAKTSKRQLSAIASQQQSRQQELELITVQRETARIEEELDQLLSQPTFSSSASSYAPLSAVVSAATFAVDRHLSGQRDKNAEKDKTSLLPDTAMMGTSHLEESTKSLNNVHAAEPMEEEAMTGGVLMDICERIAQSDIELEYLKAAHRDHLQAQERVLSDLEMQRNRLVEYYSQGVLIQDLLRLERDHVQEQTDLLSATVLECQAQEELSRRKKLLVDSTDSLTSSSINELKQLRRSVDGLHRNDRRLETLCKDHSVIQGREKQQRQILKQQVQQLGNVVEILEHQLLNQHSTTGEVLWNSTKVLEAKRELAHRSGEMLQRQILLDRDVHAQNKL